MFIIILGMFLFFLGFSIVWHKNISNFHIFLCSVMSAIGLLLVLFGVIILPIPP